MPPAEDAVTRFWRNVDASGICWEWTAGRNKSGYGRFHIARTGDGRRLEAYAHRWAWEHLVGPIPEGLVIDHLCKNTSCVNPDHLEPVDQRTNLIRSATAWAEMRRRGVGCARGHHPSERYVSPRTGHGMCRACARELDRGVASPQIIRTRSEVA